MNFYINMGFMHNCLVLFSYKTCCNESFPINRFSPCTSNSDNANCLFGNIMLKARVKVHMAFSGHMHLAFIACVWNKWWVCNWCGWWFMTLEIWMFHMWCEIMKWINCWLGRLKINIVVSSISSIEINHYLIVWWFDIWLH